MGVSIILDGKNISPGWRSKMHGLLIEGFGSGTVRLDTTDIEELERLRDNQRKGEDPPPFDWAQDIADAFDKIIARIREKGVVHVDCVC